MLKNKGRIALKDWGRIYAYLFWLKTSVGQGHQKEYKRLKKLCEQDPRTAVGDIVSSMENSAGTTGMPALNYHGRIFEHSLPQELDNFEKLTLIAQNGKRSIGVLMRLSS